MFVFITIITNSYNKNVLKLCYGINTDEIMMVCCMHAAYMPLNQ